MRIEGDNELAGGREQGKREVHRYVTSGLLKRMTGVKKGKNVRPGRLGSAQTAEEKQCVK
jgi:hypothetical protein